MALARPRRRGIRSCDQRRCRETDRGRRGRSRQHPHARTRCHARPRRRQAAARAHPGVRAVRQPPAQECPSAPQVGQARGRELLPRLRCRPARLLRRHRPVRGLPADAGPLARHRRIRCAQDHRPRTGPGPHARHSGHRTAHPRCSRRACVRQGPHAFARRLAVRQAGSRQGRIGRTRQHRAPSPAAHRRGRTHLCRQL